MVTNKEKPITLGLSREPAPAATGTNQDLRNRSRSPRERCNVNIGYKFTDTRDTSSSNIAITPKERKQGSPGSPPKAPKKDQLRRALREGLKPSSKYPTEGSGGSADQTSKLKTQEEKERPPKKDIKQEKGYQTGKGKKPEKGY